MKSVKTATLLAGAGIEGDRYVLKTGTYSAKFLYEPGRNLTLVSADGVEAQVAKTKMEPLEMSALRRICGALGAPCCYGVCLALHELFELMVCELFASGGDRAFRVDDYGILGAWSAR